MMAKCSVVIQTAPTAKKKTYETGPKYSVIGTSNLEFEGTRPNKCLRTAKTRLMQAGRQQQPADDAIPGKKC
jgi:hypothetical protein